MERVTYTVLKILSPHARPPTGGVQLSPKSYGGSRMNKPERIPQAAREFTVGGVKLPRRSASGASGTSA